MEFEVGNQSIFPLLNHNNDDCSSMIYSTSLKLSLSLPHIGKFFSNVLTEVFAIAMVYINSIKWNIS